MSSVLIFTVGWSALGSEAQVENSHVAREVFLQSVWQKYSKVTELSGILRRKGMDLKNRSLNSSEHYSLAVTTNKEILLTLLLGVKRVSKFG